MLIPKYVLSVKRLELSPQEFDDFLAISKASESSKARYCREYVRYNIISEINKEGNIEIKDKHYPKTYEYYDKNGEKRIKDSNNFANKVSMVSSSYYISIDKANISYKLDGLRRIFSELYNHRRNANYALFGIKFSFILPNKRVKDTYGRTGEDIFAASKVKKISPFSNLFNEGIVIKIEGLLSKDSLIGILVTKEFIKLYWHREKKEV
jgi:hypothetical protein